MTHEERMKKQIIEKIGIDIFSEENKDLLKMYKKASRKELIKRIGLFQFIKRYIFKMGG